MSTWRSTQAEWKPLNRTSAVARPTNDKTIIASGVQSESETDYCESSSIVVSGGVGGGGGGGGRLNVCANDSNEQQFLLPSTEI